MMHASSSIVFFDSHCHLCTASVRFILRRDPIGKLQFAPIDGTTARHFFKDADFSTSPQSLVLLDSGKFYTRSTAVLRLARTLKGAWPLLYGLVIIPLPIRNWIYDLVAKNRHRWFGKSETCWMPTATWKERFLD